MVAGNQRVVYYVAASVDGYIADADGGVGWLEEYKGHEFGYDKFYAGVGSTVVGRATFDQMLGWDAAEAKPTAVVTSSPLDDRAPASAFAVGADDVVSAVERLRGAAPGDVWVVGGGMTAAACLNAGVLDEVELTVMPVVLGSGIPLLPPDAIGRHKLELVSSARHRSGAVQSLYTVVR